MKKGLLILMILLLVGCSSKEKVPASADVNIQYEITPNLEFMEGDELDFSQAVTGDFDAIELGTPNQEVGQHLLSAILKKGETQKVISIPYTIFEQKLSSDHYLTSLSVEGVKLEPEFKWNVFSYSITLPANTTQITVTAETQAPSSKVLEGTGIIDVIDGKVINVRVEAENSESKSYDIKVNVEAPVIQVPDPQPEPSPDPIPIPTDPGIETYNGYYINYPNSSPVSFRNDNLTLVNKQYKLDASYEPSDLVQIDSSYTVYGNGFLVRSAYDAYMTMRQAASAEGLILNVSNCYRSYARQRELYTYYLNSDSQESVDTYSARPGHSEHQLGVACDFAANQKNIHEFTGTAEQLWMVNNADKYGFILRYPSGKESVTGYMYESWHYRYVGDIATDIKNSGLTLEEYLGQ